MYIYLLGLERRGKTCASLQWKVDRALIVLTYFHTLYLCFVVASTMIISFPASAAGRDSPALSLSFLRKAGVWIVLPTYF